MASFGDLDEAEARALMAMPSVCNDILPWVGKRAGGLVYCAGAGLLDSLGNVRGLYVDLSVSKSEKTDIRRTLFSVFKTGARGLARCHQLDIKHYPRLPVNEHSWPHDHFGEPRFQTQRDWVNWSFDQALSRFKSSTLITFDPEPYDPFEFRLES